MTVAHPLQWPAGWPRTPQSKRVEGRHRFKRPGGKFGTAPWSFPDARDALIEELGKLGAQYPVISTNFPLGRGGIAIQGKRRPEDEGIAIYFMRAGKPMAMACDRFHEAEANMRSLALAIDAMRQLERHGGGFMMERAFDGFTALPAPVAPPDWRSTLGLSGSPSADDIQAAYRAKAKKAHPDQGGSDAAMAALNAARDAAMRSVTP